MNSFQRQEGGSVKKMKS